MFMCTTIKTTQKKCQTSKSIVVLHKINMNSDINYDRKPCTLYLIHESNLCHRNDRPKKPRKIEIDLGTSVYHKSEPN